MKNYTLFFLGIQFDQWVWRNTYLLSVVASGHVTQVGYCCGCSCCSYANVRLKKKTFGLAQNNSWVQRLSWFCITYHSKDLNSQNELILGGKFRRKVLSAWYLNSSSNLSNPMSQVSNIINTNLAFGLSASCCSGRSEGSRLCLGRLDNVIGAGSVKNKDREMLVGGQLDLQRLTIFKPTPFAGHNATKRRCTPFLESSWRTWQIMDKEWHIQLFLYLGLHHPLFQQRHCRCRRLKRIWLQCWC